MMIKGVDFVLPQGFAVKPEWVATAGEYPIVMAEKVSKDSVNYRPATNNKRCGNCAMSTFHGTFTHGSCTLVEGLIRRDDTCDKWEAEK